MKENKYSQAAVLMICFAGMLRVSEALNLHWNDVAFPGDIRLSSFGRRVAGVRIRDSKIWRTSGKLQFVCIDDLQIIQFLRIYKKKTLHPPKFGGKLKYSSYLMDLKRVANKIRLPRHKDLNTLYKNRKSNRRVLQLCSCRRNSHARDMEVPLVLLGTTCQTEEPGCST